MLRAVPVAAPTPTHASVPPIPTASTELPPIDYQAFAHDLEALRAEVDAQLGADDLAHLAKMDRWGRRFTALGYATAWLGPNPLAIYCLAQGNTARWTMMMHHIGHRGYDKVPGVPLRYTSKHFAQGKRRYLDWLDWMDPAAWAHEHNVLHHFRTGELADPDLVEENVRAIRDADLPLAAKYGIVGFFALTWKLSYYAPNTLQVLAHHVLQEAGKAPRSERSNPQPLLAAFDVRTPVGRDFVRRCLLPYGTARFGLAPLAFAPLGPLAVASVWLNTVAAELLANVQSFVLIAPNHVGDDVYRFEGRAEGRAAFYVRQVTGSVNYRTGGDWNDFCHGFLNYQIEHHLWPELPLLRYQQLQPKVKAVCEKHGVPYVQEGVLRRVKKLVDVMVGKTSMRVAKTAARPRRAAVVPSSAGARGDGAPMGLGEPPRVG